MIKIPTVLILGAGASKPYGLPTAKGLVKDIYKMLEDRRSWEFNMVATASSASNRDVTEFANSLEAASPPSVDAWLEKTENNSFEKIGKAAIGTCLLKSEQKAKLRPPDPKVDWYEILWHRLIEEVSFESFHKNKLSVITFNYDRSLEQELFTRLKNTYKGKRDEEYAQKFIDAIPIIHVYGSLAPLPWQRRESNSQPIPYDVEDYLASQPKYKKEIDLAYARRSLISYAMKNIELIPEEAKTPAETDRFKEAHKYIEAANALYFLGFGYHPLNVKRLGIKTLQKPQKVMGTIYGLPRTEKDYINTSILNQYAPRENMMVPCDVATFLKEHVNFNTLST